MIPAPEYLICQHCHKPIGKVGKSYPSDTDTSIRCKHCHRTSYFWTSLTGLLIGSKHVPIQGVYHERK